MNWQLDDEEFASERLETVFTVRRSLVSRSLSEYRVERLFREYQNP